MLNEFLLNQEGFYIYLLVFLTLLGGACFLPFPEDLILITVGVLVQREIAHWEVLLPLAYLAIILGDIILYGIGYRFGITLFSRRWFRNKVHPKKIKQVREQLDKNYLTTILLGRHLFYLRSLTFVCCGAVKMSFWKYILADMVAALISMFIMVSIGFYASENYDSVMSKINGSEHWVAIGFLLLGGLFYYFKIHRKIKEI